MARRPYLQMSAYQLSELTNEHFDELDELEVIYYELSHRSTNYSRMLREKVGRRIEYLVSVENYQAQTELFLERMAYDLAIVNEFGVDIKNDILRNQVIAVTGRDPSPENTLRTLVFLLGGNNSDFEIWEDWMIIVLGKKDFDKTAIEKTIRLSLDKHFQLEFMSQGDFIHYIETGELTPYVPGDPRIYDHPGLAYVSSIGFHWPFINPSNEKLSQKSQSRGSYDHREDHPLRIVYGYSVSKQLGLTEEERRRRLSHAVKRLGLHEVVEHLADLVNERKLTQPERMKNAIYLWESDLVWLRRTYYDGSIYVFDWPSY